jgi:hypothetical protein
LTQYPWWAGVVIAVFGAGVMKIGGEQITRQNGCLGYPLVLFGFVTAAAGVVWTLAIVFKF